MSQVETTVSIKKTCPHCGNNPVSHFGARVDSTLAVMLDPFMQLLAKTGIGTFFIALTDLMLDTVLKLLLLSGAAVFDFEKIDDVAERGKVLIEEARARGWSMATLRVFGKATGTFKIILPNGKEHVFRGLPVAGEHVDMLAGWIDDKAILKERLSVEGITVSKGKSFSEWKEAEKYFDSAEKPLIIKPRFGSRGRHTTTHIMTKEDFKRAFMIGKQLCNYVVVEEHLVGSVYRGTVIDGVFAGVLAGDPPKITGDGIRTIKELIEQKNMNRHERVGEVKFTDTLNIFLKKFSYTLDTVLDEGNTIDLSEKIGLSYGGNAREVTPQVHPKLRLELERAAKIIGEPFLGFDFITTDVGADPETIKWGIIECNSVPFINLHHDPLEGEPVNVAKMVLDYFEQNTHYNRVVTVASM